MSLEDAIAINFYNQAVAVAPNPKSKKVSAETIKKYQVVWNGETVEELATGKKISIHNWNEKMRKINYFRDQFLAGNIPNPPKILVVKDTNYKQYLIIDGIHRSVGFYKAWLIDPSIVEKTNLNYLLFESDRIIELFDYQRIFS